MEADNSEKIKALEEILKAEPSNFRIISQVYTDQISLVRRTDNAVSAAIEQAKSSSSMLFDFSNDPLMSLTLDEVLIEQQTRIVDLIVLAGFGQKIEVPEFQDYAKTLVPLYASYDFIGKIKNSALKNSALRELEQEWLEGSDFVRVQQFFKSVIASVEAAAQYCNIAIHPLPEF